MKWTSSVPTGTSRNRDNTSYFSCHFFSLSLTTEVLHRAANDYKYIYSGATDIICTCFYTDDWLIPKSMLRTYRNSMICRVHCSTALLNTIPQDGRSVCWIFLVAI